MTNDGVSSVQTILMTILAKKQALLGELERAPSSAFLKGDFERRRRIARVVDEIGQINDALKRSSS